MMVPVRLKFFSRAVALAATALISIHAQVRAEEISVTQWGASLYGAPYAVAMEKGLFKQAGIDITGILGSGGGGTTVRNILASPTPYGEVAIGAALAAKAQGTRSRCRERWDPQRRRSLDGRDAKFQHQEC